MPGFLKLIDSWLTMLNECFCDKSIQIGQISHENNDGLEMRMILQKLVHPIVWAIALLGWPLNRRYVDETNARNHGKQFSQSCSAANSVVSVQSGNRKKLASFLRKKVEEPLLRSGNSTLENLSCTVGTVVASRSLSMLPM